MDIVPGHNVIDPPAQARPHRHRQPHQPRLLQQLQHFSPFFIVWEKRLPVVPAETLSGVGVLRSLDARLYHVPDFYDATIIVSLATRVRVLGNVHVPVGAGTEGFYYDLAAYWAFGVGLQTGFDALLVKEVLADAGAFQGPALFVGPQANGTVFIFVLFSQLNVNPNKSFLVTLSLRVRLVKVGDLLPPVFGAHEALCVAAVNKVAV